MTYIEAVLAYLLGTAKTDIGSHAQQFVEAITRQTIFSPSTREEARSQLLLLQDRLEQQMKTIVMCHSSEYWLHVFRRLTPGALYEVDSAVTVSLVQQILECAIFKYSVQRRDEFIIFDNLFSGTLIASGNFGKISAFDFGIDGARYVREFDRLTAESVITLKCLAYEYWHTTVCLRRLYKGGEFVFEEGEYYVQNDIDTETLVQHFDRRNARKSIAATHQGVPYQFSAGSGIGASLLAVYNAHQISYEDYPILGLNEYNWIPAMIWVPVDLHAYYACNAFLSEEFARNNSYSLSDVVTFIYLLGVYAVLQISKGRNAQLASTGYSIWSSTKRLCEGLMEISDRIQPPLEWASRPTPEGLLQVIDSLVVETGEQISLSTRGPRPLIVRCSNSDGLLLDHAGIIALLNALGHRFEDVERKGRIFEEFACEHVRSIPGVSVVWASKRLRSSDGSSKEIDLAYLYKETLYLVEEKSVSMSVAFDEGKPKALEYRKLRFQRALREVDEKARWLGVHREVLPRECSAIVPVVVSPFVEYVWSLDPGLWLTGDTPRVCTLDDLASMRYAEVDNEVRRRPFTIMV